MLSVDIEFRIFKNQEILGYLISQWGHKLVLSILSGKLSKRRYQNVIVLFTRISSMFIYKLISIATVVHLIKKLLIPNKETVES